MRRELLLSDNPGVVAVTGPPGSQPFLAARAGAKKSASS
jgi:hypothetical protein